MTSCSQLLLWMVTRCIFTVALSYRHSCNPHFTDEKTSTERVSHLPMLAQELSYYGPARIPASLFTLAIDYLPSADPAFKKLTGRYTRQGMPGVRFKEP